jgi:hypothetical protein
VGRADKGKAIPRKGDIQTMHGAGHGTGVPHVMRRRELRHASQAVRHRFLPRRNK